MRIIVKLFGPEAALAGTHEIAVEVAGAEPTCGELKRALAEAEPRLAESLSYCRIALNHDFAGPNQVIHARDEVALIGMVSGG